MATIDSRYGDENFRGEVYLKIWSWHPKIGTWILNTRIDRPHGLAAVTCVAFSPECKDRTAVQLVTTGDDLNAKIWGLRSIKDKAGDFEGKTIPGTEFRYFD